MTDERKALDGCRSCAAAFMYGGSWKCGYNPHDYQTPMQRAIVAWLSSIHVNPMTSPGCPGYEEAGR